MPPPNKSPRKKVQPVKRSAEWREAVHAEAMSALARARQRDAVWRAKRDEARRRAENAEAWMRGRP
jgi:hypothetical protein